MALCYSASVPPRSGVIGKVSLSVRRHGSSSRLPSVRLGLPFSRRLWVSTDVPSRVLFPQAATPRRHLRVQQLASFHHSSPSLLHSSSLFSPIRISGHILCSFSQVSHPSRRRPSLLCSTPILTPRQLWSHYQSRTLRKFDIYDPVSPFHHPIFFSPLPARTPPHPMSSSPAIACEVCFRHTHRSPSKFARPYPSLL